MKQLLLISVLFLFSCNNEKEHEITSVNSITEVSELDGMTDISNETLDKLGASVILCLKENSFEKFTNLLPLHEDVEEIAQKYNGPADKKKQLEAKMGETVKKIMISSKTGFDQVFNSALKENVVWKDAKFDHAEYSINKKDNLQMAAVDVYFVHNNNKYKIKIGECVNSKRGWLITDRPYWAKENN